MDETRSRRDKQGTRTATTHRAARKFRISAATTPGPSITSKTTSTLMCYSWINRWVSRGAVMSVSDQIWRELYEAERLMRYFERVANKFNKYYIWATYLTISSVVAAAIALLADNIPNMVSALMILLAGALVLATVIWEFSAKAANARLATASYRHLSYELQELWYRGASQSRVNLFKQIKINIANSTNIQVDQKINNETADEAYEYLSAFAAREQGAPTR